MRRLRRCREIWGTDEHAASAPGLETVRDALYLPMAGGAPWGLFDGARSLGQTGQSPPSDIGTVETAPDGHYLYAGPLVPHYGHFMIETLSRLWPLLDWEGAPPTLVCHRPSGAPETAFVHAMLAGLGVGPERIVSFDRPVRLPAIVVPERSFAERARVHAAFGALCRAVGSPHWGDAIDAVERPVYLSKSRVSAGMGHLVNERAVEAELDRLGVEIVHPQDLAFAEQVRLLSARRTILGPTSSALHTTAFAAPGRRVLGLNWAHHLSANFPLFDRASGTHARYYWGLGTRYAEVAGHGIGWTLDEPATVARELVESARAFDGLDARDDAFEAAEARRLDVRLRRWRRAIRDRLGRVVRDLRRG